MFVLTSPALYFHRYLYRRFRCVAACTILYKLPGRQAGQSKLYCRRGNTLVLIKTTRSSSMLKG